MPEIRFPHVQALDQADRITYMADGRQLVSLEFHDAFVSDMRALHQHDLDWARSTCAAHGIDLDEIAASDSDYRSGWRI